MCFLVYKCINVFTCKTNFTLLNEIDRSELTFFVVNHACTVSRRTSLWAGEHHCEQENITVSRWTSLWAGEHHCEQENITVSRRRSLWDNNNYIITVTSLLYVMLYWRWWQETIAAKSSKSPIIATLSYMLLLEFYRELRQICRTSQLVMVRYRN